MRLFCTCIVAILNLSFAQVADPLTSVQNSTGKPDNYEHQFENHNNPVNIFTKIEINKIYGINTLDETYIIDGYLTAIWYDAKNQLLLKSDKDVIIYENQIADDKVGNEVWVPAFEFINVVSSRDIGNKQIIIEEAGKTTYNERFNAVFTTNMDFKKFPFDNQCFSIQLEAFSYDTRSIVFSNENSDEESLEQQMSEEWEVTESRIYINSQEYSHLSRDGAPITFSRYTQEIYAERKIRYYLWQFILPLFLITGISWSVFWISGLSDQLATSFTLMLTVVAFNFSTSSMLPTLPYSTFIESMITLGYLSISISLIVIIWGHAAAKTNRNFNLQKLMNRCKYIFPLSFTLLVLFQIAIFFI